VELLESWWTTGTRRRESDRTRRSLLHAAEVLGARQIKIGPDVGALDGRVPPLADADHWAAELHRLAAQAAEVGARVALEPLPFSNVTDFRVASELVAAADHDAAGLVVDIWHLERGPSTLADLAEVPGEKVFVVELNDAPAPKSTDLFHDTIHHRVPCGCGTFDVRGFIETLTGIGFTGPWGVEIISDVHRGKPLRVALADAYRTTMAVFDSLTVERTSNEVS
jgi:sugar phosphate isomerase/epimerase